MRKLLTGITYPLLLVCLAGSSVYPQYPSVLFQPDSLAVSLNTCNDSTTVSLQIQNTGSDLLFYSVLQVSDFIDGFEEGLDNWLISSHWGLSSVAYAGNYSISESPGSLYGDGWNDYIWMKDSLFIADEDSAYLSFYVQYSLECGYDYLYPQLSVNNGAWVSLATLNCPATGWTLLQYDLGSYVSNGDFIKIRFYFHSDGSVTGQGTEIDEVRVCGVGNMVTWAFFPEPAGVVLPGQTETLDIIVNSTDLLSGTYFYEIILTTNDPLNQEVIIPLSLVFSGYPLLSVAETQHDFGAIMEFTQKTDTLWFANEGCDPLIVDTMYCSSPDFIPLQTNFTLSPGDLTGIAFSFLPDSTGTYTSDLFLVTNDTTLDPAQSVMTLTGTGTDAPVIEIIPDSLSVTAACGDSTASTLVIHNNGLADLVLRLSGYSAEGLILHYPFDGDAADQGPSQLDGIIYGALPGTDREGNPSGALTFDGANDYVDVPDGIYFSGNYSVTAWMNEISYKSWSRLFDFGNGPASNNVLGAASRGTAGQYLAEVYQGAASGGQTYTTAALPLNQWNFVCQVLEGIHHKIYLNGQLVKTGTAAYQPLNIMRTNNFIGRSNWSADYYYHGQIDDFRIYNRALNQDEITQLYSAEFPSWLSIDVQADTIPPGDSLEINLAFNALSLTAGTYLSLLNIASNDPLSPVTLIPLTFTVYGDPEIASDTNFLDFDSTIQHVPVYRDLVIFNGGCDTLHLQSVDFSDTVFSSTNITAPYSIAPFGSDTMRVVFHPADTGFYSAVLLLNGDAGPLTVGLQAYAGGAPHLLISPDTASVTIQQCNDTATMDIQLFNQGLADLHWELGDQPGGGQALSFTASGQYVQAGNLGTLPNEGTIEFWMKTYQLKNYNNCFTTHGTGSTNIGFRFEETSSGNFYVVAGNDQNSASSYYLTSALSINEWHHIAVTWDKASNRLWTYYDGNVVSNGVTHNKWASQFSNVMIGVGYTSSRWWNGMMDEVRIWNFRLSGEEIQGAMRYPMIGSVPGLIACWNFNEGSGDTLHDITPGQHHGTFTGAAWMPSDVPMIRDVTASPLSGTISPGSSAQVTLSFNGNEKNAGHYPSAILITSDDPLLYFKLYPCLMKVEGEAQLAADTSEFYFGDLLVGDTVSLPVTFFNPGCDSLEVDSTLNPIAADFSLEPFPFVVLPKDSFQVHVRFHPATTGFKQEWITLQSNAGTWLMYTEGTGLEPPVIATDPAQLFAGVICDGVAEVPLTLYNNGLGELSFLIPANGNSGSTITPASCIPVTTNYCCGMGIKRVMFHTIYQVSDNASEGYMDFTGIPPAVLTPGNGYYLTVITGEEYNENVAAWIDYNNDGDFSVEEQVMLSTQIYDTVHIGWIDIPWDAVSGTPLRMRVMSDYIYESEPQPCVNPYYGQAEDYPVLIASGLLVPEIIQTIAPLDSTTIMITFSGNNLPVGVYPSLLSVYSNDPLNPLIIIPTELSVEGTALVGLDESAHDFGEVTAFTESVYQLALTNTGCDNLDIYSIDNSNPLFYGTCPVSLVYPGTSQPLILHFAPDGTGYSDGEIILITNIGDFVIYVEGTGIAPPEIHVDPVDLYASAACGEAAETGFTIDNWGEGILHYQITTFPELDDGLLAYYPFIGNPNDDGPSGRHLINYGAWLAEGNTWMPENGYFFDYQAYMSYENWNDIMDNLFNQQFSISLWTLVPDTALWQDEAPCLFHISNSNWDLEGIGILIENNQIRATVNIDYEVFNLYCDIDSDQWMHLTLTYDGNTIRLYKNAGIQDAVDAVGYISYNYDLPVMNLGTLYDYEGYDHFFTGYLDELRLYNRPLAETEIQHIQQNAHHFLDISTFPVNDSIGAYDWHDITVTISTEGLIAGNYEDVIGVLSDDPLQQVVWLPVYLEVTGTPVIEAGPPALEFDTLMQFTTQTLEATVSNPSCAPLFIWDIYCTDPSFYPAFPNLVVSPNGSNTIPVTFSPQQEGFTEGFLYLDSEAGLAEIYLSGNCTGIPAASVSPTSVNEILSCQESVDVELELLNSGFVDMEYAVVEPANSWFGGIDVSGALCAGCSLTIPFMLNRSNLNPGLYNFVVHINTNDPVNPMLTVPVYLLVPNPLVPVYLGADTGYCAGGSLMLDAGNYSSYLWNDGSAARHLLVSSPGTYWVDVLDTYDCPSTDTIVIIEFEIPVADAGNDTAVCEGTPLFLHGNASGTQPPVFMQLTIGQASGYTSSTGPNPFGTYYMDHRAQYLYRVEELQQHGLIAGTFNDLGFILNGVGSPGLSGLNISAGTTSQQTLTGFIGGLTTVFSADYYLPVTGENIFPLQTPFFYDGESNLVIEVCFNNNSWVSNSSYRYTATSGCVWARHCDNCAPGCSLTGGSAYQERPDLIINGYAGLATYSWTGPGGFVSSLKNPGIQHMQPADAGTYQLTVDNGYGCVDTDELTVTVEPSPLVNAGPDGNILGGESYTFQAVVTGGAEPYGYSWIPSIYLDDTAILNATATPVFTTQYTLVVTGVNGCLSSDEVTIQVIPRFSLSGHVTYDNALYSALGNVMVKLTDPAHVPIDSTMTDQSGNYLFPYLFEGSYLVNATTAQEAGSINATDALKTGRHVVKLETLSGLSLTAADVNASATVTGGDALLILHRSVGNIATFPAGDWHFESGNVLIQGTDAVKDFMGICIGDVNTSFIPGLKPEPSVTLVREGFLAIPPDSIVMLPVSLREDSRLGAVTLNIEIPNQSMHILDLSMPEGQLATRITGNILSLAWNNHDGIAVKAREPFLVIRLRCSSLPPPDGLYIGLTGDNEIADATGNLIAPAILSYPDILPPDRTGNGFYLGQNQPNPFRNATTIPFLLPEPGQVSLELCNILGERIVFLDCGKFEKGFHQLPLAADGLPAGIYSYRMTYKGLVHQVQQSRLMIISK